MCPTAAPRSCSTPWYPQKAVRGHRGVESFWGRMQTELLNRRKWRTRIELANAIFECLEIFHNRQRRHSALGPRNAHASRVRTTRPGSQARSLKPSMPTRRITGRITVRERVLARSAGADAGARAVVRSDWAHGLVVITDEISIGFLADDLPGLDGDFTDIGGYAGVV